MQEANRMMINPISSGAMNFPSINPIPPISRQDEAPVPAITAPIAVNTVNNQEAAANRNEQTPLYQSDGAAAQQNAAAIPGVIGAKFDAFA